MSREIDDVRDAISDGNWHNLDEIAARAGHPAAACSARIRELRGGPYLLDIEERKHRKGSSDYRLVRDPRPVFEKPLFGVPESGKR